jgi:2-polyprenyl-3-methyl-5-hydroxy-6-metoxy-1,4-benzoquinol methylase
MNQPSDLAPRESLEQAQKMTDPAIEVAFSGFEQNRIRVPVVENLTDEELRELNALLPWKCFVADSHGRRFGLPASATKRNAPSVIPDHRIVALDKRFGLSDLTVLEIGCFEGVHTVALAGFAKHVKGCDSRIVNVAKTAVRCAMFQVPVTLFVWDVEKPIPASQDASCDILHHVGVLYHLVDPVSHLRMIAPHVRRAIMLDTHYAVPEKATQSYAIGGRSYSFFSFREGGLADPFSGMYPTARWLTLADLIGLLKELGFTTVDLVNDRLERNGPRCLIVAER